MASVPLISIYVSDIERSMDFYDYVFNCSIPEISNGFALLPITDNIVISLAQVVNRTQRIGGIGGGVEISFSVGDKNKVEEVYARFEAIKAEIPHKITTSNLGTAFVGVDPDGHRLRICSPPKNNLITGEPNY